jgi:Uma2 family endonuclease
MSSATRKTRAPAQSPDIRPVTKPLRDPSIPLLHEDDGFEEMGDADVHTRTINILFNGLQYHLARQPKYHVFANLNLYYSRDDATAYLSPDVMIVTPSQPLPKDIRSYHIGEDGPAPLFVAEVLSERTSQERDLTDKPLIYAGMRVPEYALLDVRGQYLSVRLLLKHLLPGGAWRDGRDSDGGLSSRLGFRVILESDGQIRILDAATGKRYVRPDEAQSTADQLEERIRTLESELARQRRRRKKKE